MNIFFKAALIGTALMVFTAGCGGSKSRPDAQSKKTKPVVQAAKAEKRDLSKVMVFTGSVKPVKVAQMASPAEGPIVECLVREGDFVKKGQSLVKVGRRHIADTALDAAREELRRQESDFKRIEQLVKSGSLPGEQIDTARADLKRAEAQVAAMETGAADYEIKAPWDGVVAHVWSRDGDYVVPRENLVELYAPESLVVQFYIPEQEALMAHAGQSVQLSLDAYPGRSFEAEIVRVYPELEQMTRTLTAEAALHGDIKLLSGMFARVETPVQTIKDAVVVPEGALITLPNGEAVMFALNGETVARRKVKIALEAGGFIAIAGGIEAGDMVVTRGHEMLKDGAEVQVMGQKKKEAAADGEPGKAPAAEPKGKPKL